MKVHGPSEIICTTMKKQAYFLEQRTKIVVIKVHGESYEENFCLTLVCYPILQ